MSGVAKSLCAEHTDDLGAWTHGAAGGRGGQAGRVGHDAAENSAEDRLPQVRRSKRAGPCCTTDRFRGQAGHLGLHRQRCHGGRRDHLLDYAEFGLLPTVEVKTDFHCVTRFSMLDTIWSGVSATTCSTVPPHVDATHVTVWAEYGYSANVRIEDLRREGVVSPPTVRANRSPGPRLPLRLIVPHLYAWKARSGSAGSSTSSRTVAASGKSAAITHR